MWTPAYLGGQFEVDCSSVRNECFGASLQAQPDPRPTYEEVIKGMACRQSSRTGSLECTYRVGKDLEFVIAGVGEEDAAITVLRTAGYAGEYYATFGVKHGCVIVKPGSSTLRTGQSDMAFVSPRTSKVYAEWEDCREATKTRSNN